MITVPSNQIPGLRPADAQSPLEQLARRADVNRDGQVSNPEFAGFLSDLMQSLDREQAATPAPQSAEPATRPLDLSRLEAKDIPAPSPAASAALLRAAVLAASKER